MRESWKKIELSQNLRQFKKKVIGMLKEVLNTITLT